MAKSCPSCGAEAAGKFCAQCGTALGAPVCAACGNPIPAGGRFCNMCGTQVAGATGRGGGKKTKAARAAAAEVSPAPATASRNLPWFVAGAAVLALAVVVLLPRFRAEPQPELPSAPFAGQAGGAGADAPDPGSIDLSSMTPREAADRLFNRVMLAVSQGDSTQARSFAPMAAAAYEMVPGLDLDGRYHLAVIHLVNRQPDEALAAANAILEEAPTHLFGHFTAAEAEQMRGDTDAARQHFQHFLDNYADEMSSGRPEYSDHAAVLPEMREQALRAVGG